jgi:predicted DsbA family dithiol-disulfide isomerase
MGLNLPAYRGCLDSERPRAVIEADKSEAADLTLKSTPTFVLGNLRPDGQVSATDVLLGAQPIEALRAVLDKRLKEAPSPR